MAKAATQPEIIDLATWWGRNTAAAPQIGSLLQRGVRVRRLKRILPVVAVLIVVAALLWPLLSAMLATRIVTEALTPELAMLNLDYTGRDKNGRPFRVEADKAVRQANNQQANSQVQAPGTVPQSAAGGPGNEKTGSGPGNEKTGQIGTLALTAPVAVLQQDNGQTVSLKSATGVYNEAQQGLTLDGTVQIGNSGGVRVVAPDLAVDLKGNRAWTDKPAMAAGDFGRIDGQGLRLEDGGKRIIFTGKSRAVLNGAPRATTPATQAE